MVRLHRHAFFNLYDRHGGVAPEQFRHHTFLFRVHMRDKDERQPAVGWHLSEELFERFESAG